jgi:hypothetical protein
MAKGQQRSNKEVRKPKAKGPKKINASNSGWDSKRMKIEGNIRSNLISAISAVRRWRGRPVHRDTVNYWHGVLEQGRRASILSASRLPTWWQSLSRNLR